MKDQHISDSLKLFEQGEISRAELLAHIGIRLASREEVEDYLSLPGWLKGDLDEWAAEFEIWHRWVLLSNAGANDVTAEGERLLALITKARKLPQ